MLEYSFFLFSIWISNYFRNTMNFDYYYYHRWTNRKGVKQQTKRCTDIKEIECKLNEKRNNTCEMQNKVEFEGKRKFQWVVHFTIFIICSILLRIRYYLSLSVRAPFSVSISAIDQFEWLHKYKAHNNSKSKREKKGKIYLHFYWKQFDLKLP